MHFHYVKWNGWRKEGTLEKGERIFFAFSKKKKMRDEVAYKKWFRDEFLEKEVRKDGWMDGTSVERKKRGEEDGMWLSGFSSSIISNWASQVQCLVQQKREILSSSPPLPKNNAAKSLSYPFCIIIIIWGIQRVIFTLLTHGAARPYLRVIQLNYTGRQIEAKWILHISIADKAASFSQPYETHWSPIMMMAIAGLSSLAAFTKDRPWLPSCRNFSKEDIRNPFALFFANIFGTILRSLICVSGHRGTSSVPSSHSIHISFEMNAGPADTCSLKSMSKNRSGGYWIDLTYIYQILHTIEFAFPLLSPGHNQNDADAKECQCLMMMCVWSHCYWNLCSIC